MISTTLCPAAGLLTVTKIPLVCWVLTVSTCTFVVSTCIRILIFFNLKPFVLVYSDMFVCRDAIYSEQYTVVITRMRSGLV